MIALFDRLSSPFSDNRIERIREEADTILGLYFSDYPVRFEMIENELKALDSIYLPENETIVRRMFRFLTHGQKQFSAFRQKLNLSIVKTIQQMNQTDPEDSFYTLIYNRFSRDFDDEYQNCFLDQQDAKKNIKTEMLSGHRNVRVGETFLTVHTVLSSYLDLLQNNDVKKVMVDEISRVFDEENNYRNRLIESVTEELQRIISTKVYLDTDSSRKTIMNYGVSSIVNVSVGNARHYDRVCNELKTSIEAFESRLVNPRVYLVKNKNYDTPVNCIIEGKIKGDETQEVLKFPMTL